jgi:protein MpaA
MSLARSVPRRTSRASARAVLAAALLAGLLAGGPAAVATTPAEATARTPAASSVAAVAREPVQETTVLGTSVKKRKIRAIRRYWPGVEDRKTLVVIGTIHGDEPAGRRVTALLRTAKLPRNLDLWIIPTANPDGTAAKRRTNARKVDLNRNFPYRWKKINVGTSTYSGPAKASEPETRALMRFFRKVKPDQTVVFHQPLNGVGTTVKRMDVVRALARRTGLPVKSFACTGVCRGSFSSWHNNRLPGVAVTVEFPRKVKSKQVRRAAAAVLRVGSRL